MEKKYNKEEIDRWIRYRAAAEFKRAAANGEIAVLGRKAGKGSHELIPTVYWLKASLDHDPIISKRGKVRDDGVRTQVGLESVFDGGIPIYTDLQVIYSGVLKAWPATTRWRKFWRRVTARWRR